MKARVTGRSTLSATVPAAAAPTAPKATAAAMTWLSVDTALLAVSSKVPGVLTDERLTPAESIQASVRVSMVLTDLAPPPETAPPMLASMATAATVDLDLMVASSLACRVTSPAALTTAPLNTACTTLEMWLSATEIATATDAPAELADKATDTAITLASMAELSRASSSTAPSTTMPPGRVSLM